MSLHRVTARTAFLSVLSLVAAVGLAGLPGAPAVAAPTPTSVPVMVVLDASGSMTTDDAPGPRIDAAKAAVASLVDSLPATAQIGLTVYGTQTGSSDAEREAGCQDILTLVPVGPLDKVGYVNAVNTVQARGYTPIGAALQHAAAALPAGQPASIVLVSDGQDTCAPPPPCDVAAQLKAANPGLVIHTIGFLVDQGARDELTCIANATGGLYGDASDAGRLGALLRGQVDAGLHPYITSGTPIVGTPAPAGAPTLVQGQYTDAFPAGAGTTKYYAIALAAPETLYVATTIIPGALRGSGVESKLTVRTELVDGAGHNCLGTDRESDSVQADKVDPVTSVLSGVVGGDNWSRNCQAPGIFYVGVTRDSATTSPTASETVVRIEPPVEPVPAAVNDIPPALSAPAIGPPTTTCEGGASFNTAPVLTSGTTCSDSLATGETRYYRVTLGWGQRLSYQIEVDPVANADRSSFINSAVSSPLRQPLSMAAGNAERGFGGPYAVNVNGSTLVPVEYGNRSSRNSGVRAYRLAGDYYIALGLSYPTDAAPARTPVRIAVVVDGAIQPAPNYQPLPTAEPSGESSSSGPGTPSSAGSTPAAADDAAGGSAGVPWWVWPVVGIALAAAGGATVALTRRRSR
jgi:Ca-activated chloride channel family protein